MQSVRYTVNFNSLSTEREDFNIGQSVYFQPFEYLKAGLNFPDIRLLFQIQGGSPGRSELELRIGSFRAP